MQQEHKRAHLILRKHSQKTMASTSIKDCFSLLSLWMPTCQTKNMSELFAISVKLLSCACCLPSSTPCYVFLLCILWWAWTLLTTLSLMTNVNDGDSDVFLYSVTKGRFAELTELYWYRSTFLLMLSTKTQQKDATQYAVYIYIYYMASNNLLMI